MAPQGHISKHFPQLLHPSKITTENTFLFIIFNGHKSIHFSQIPQASLSIIKLCHQIILIIDTILFLINK
jgi:hypothetical protein